MSPEIVSLAQGEFAWSISVPADAPRDRLASQIAEAIAVCDRNGEGALQVWVEAVRPADNDVLAPFGLEPYRDLLQLVRPLPAPPSGIEKRPFTDGDAEAFLAVNNRAFHWHPEQSGMTIDDLAARQAEPWFRPDGFRLLELDGRLAGFCWTKIHRDLATPTGEIYVIAIDPDFHGRGLGGPMTLAGLEWLADQGLTTGMLYVESDNAPAVATYERLGFTIHHTNRAYRRASKGTQ